MRSKGSEENSVWLTALFPSLWRDVIAIDIPGQTVWLNILWKQLPMLIILTGFELKPCQDALTPQKNELHEQRNVEKSSTAPSSIGLL